MTVRCNQTVISASSDGVFLFVFCQPEIPQGLHNCSLCGIRVIPSLKSSLIDKQSIEPPPVFQWSVYDTRTTTFGDFKRVRRANANHQSVPPRTCKRHDCYRVSCRNTARVSKGNSLCEKGQKNIVPKRVIFSTNEAVTSFYRPRRTRGGATARIQLT